MEILKNNSLKEKINDITLSGGASLSTFVDEIHPVYIGSQILYDYYSKDTSEAVTETLLGSYEYFLIDGIFNGITIPNGFHKEYRLTADVRTSRSGNLVYCKLNNISTQGAATWSANSFRVIDATDFFKESDIVLEPTYNYTHTNGINLKIYCSGNVLVEIYNITIHGYLVKN